MRLNRSDNCTRPTMISPTGSIIVLLSFFYSPSRPSSVQSNSSGKRSLSLTRRSIVLTLVRSEPISCWAPAQYSGPQVVYTNSICWLKGTYYLDQGERLIPHHTQNTEFRIAYYQFVPYILLGMALLFYLPHMLW